MSRQRKKECGGSRHNKNNGMNFILIQCDLDLNKFHTYEYKFS